ncbi:ribonuclease P protein component [bacterium (Candidatus Gribaldobacteria) CG08_land_8_20_14_0_20_39_15]|uniref:Ribonuclease P protein component n=1 Tax=bacterium (Candidatus Gribaldobacteria) CG08_land_8_20_14_0_20_39_15 TaxID=2014273 RepID=A0A2M6XV99_9BACT|nr:MAG: ribonuclease P protein component [bacterium (Candidatus Gribaldobacteria) CG08_land_8_20_14_0_20_39_15]
MLPKEHRLKKKNDFSQVLRHGFALADSCLVLRFCRNQQELSRVGFVCSKKVAKKAVSRNRIKRCLREVVRMLLPNIMPGYDLVFLVRPGLVDKDSATFRLVMERLLKKARITSKN